VAAHEHADALIAGLGQEGITARAYYRTPVHRQPAMAPFAPDSDLPVTEDLARTNLALPMGPAVSGDDVERVVAAVQRVCLAT
jgi:dTDP-4-amino-4,6-dideoxygalactose transaminase